MIAPVRANPLLTPQMVLVAYEQGLFPMANHEGEIGFYMYDPRGIVPIDDRFKVRRSVRQILNKGEYHVTFDTTPRQVLECCAREGLVPENEIWLSEELIELYLKLFAMGRMHTVEVWKETPGNPDVRRLIGGLYGITFGAVFCGESMFSNEPYGSQVALVHLVERLREKGFYILDAQMPSDHLRQFGLYEMSQLEYLDVFHRAASEPVSF